MTRRSGSCMKGNAMKRFGILAGAVAVATALLTPIGGNAEATSRADLAIGVSEYVTEEAITTANSDRFAEARSGWGDDSAFVDQLDYQLWFRTQNDYMSADLDHIVKVMRERRDSDVVATLGLYVSIEEEVEFLRRQAVGDRFDAVVDEIAPERTRSAEEETERYGNTYAGLWMDQHDGGRVVLAVTDRAKLNEDRVQGILGPGVDLTIVEQKYSYDHLNDIQGRIYRNLRDAGIESDVSVEWSSERGRELVVTVEQEKNANDRLVQEPRDAYSVMRGIPSKPAGSPDVVHSTGDLQPGLRVTTGMTCTWGFNGHTSGYHYAVTAGHCFQPDGIDNHTGWVGDNTLAVYQGNSNGPRLDNFGNTFIVSKYVFGKDYARFTSSYANDNCYHGNHAIYGTGAHCQWPMRNRASHDSWEVGVDLTCASLGNSGVYRCGYISAENHNGERLIRVDINAILGDSGSGFKYGNRADALLHSISAGRAYAHTAYDLQSRLGFWLNCASSQTTHSNPGSWAICPVVDA